MTITLNDSETAVLLDMLERYSDVLGNAGCNDYTVPATEESRQMLIDAYREPDADEEEWMPNLTVRNGEYCCMDWILVDYLKSRIEAGKP